MNKEQALLIKLNEECSEVAKVTTKALRFGLDSVRDDISNRENLTLELADIIAAAELLARDGVIQMPSQSQIFKSKLRTLKGLERSQEIGIVK